jgi:hypothetical protein
MLFPGPALGPLGTSRGVGAFSPASVSGLVLWLKADSLALSDGQAVSTWTDSSSAGNNATTASGGTSPTYKTNIQNGLPAVRFNASNPGDGLTTSLNLADGWTIFLVEKPQSATPGNVRTVNSNGENRVISASRTTGNSVYIGGNVSNFSVGDTNTHLLEVRDHATNGATYKVDQTDHTDTSGTHADWQGVSLGWVTNEAANAYVMEVIAYNSAIASGDESSVVNYLKTRWGI